MPTIARFFDVHTPTDALLFCVSAAAVAVFLLTVLELLTPPRR